jgi:hypothetical protein
VQGSSFDERAVKDGNSMDGLTQFGYFEIIHRADIRANRLFRKGEPSILDQNRLFCMRSAPLQLESGKKFVRFYSTAPAVPIGCLRLTPEFILTNAKSFDTLHNDFLDGIYSQTNL